jgi:L-fuculose-phosphate aldolase
MAHHGAVTLGQSLAKALDLVAYLEYICDLHLRALATGLPVRTLSTEEIEGVVADLQGYGQQKPAD